MVHKEWNDPHCFQKKLFVQFFFKILFNLGLNRTFDVWRSTSGIQAFRETIFPPEPLKGGIVHLGENSSLLSLKPCLSGQQVGLKLRLLPFQHLHGLNLQGVKRSLLGDLNICRYFQHFLGRLQQETLSIDRRGQRNTYNTETLVGAFAREKKMAWLIFIAKKYLVFGGMPNIDDYANPGIENQRALCWYEGYKFQMAGQWVTWAAASRSRCW